MKSARAWWSARRTRTKVILIIVGLLLLNGVANSGSKTSTADTAATRAPTLTAPTAPIATGTTAPTAPPTASPAPTASRAPTAPPTPKPTPSPVVIRGTGQTATDSITLPAPISIASITYTGSSNFVVQVVGGNDPLQSLLVNKIGSYAGTRPLTGTSPIRLQIEASGPWTVTIAPIACCASSGAFASHGDAASNQFTAAGGKTWDITNDGSSNFVVILHCQGSFEQLVENRIGPFTGSTIIAMPSGPCYWEVQSSGNWSLTPR